MSIEPHHARTVHIRAAIPPKPEPVTLAPKLSMADEAAQVRARTHRAWGFTTSTASGTDANAKRNQEAQARRAALILRVMDLLQSGPATAAEMRAALGETQAQLCNALTQAKAQGLIDYSRWGRGARWHINTDKGVE
ncbi:MAG TPA: hypothetical protein PK225_03900 [Azonexus sp.]|nr:hypothetical protein [Azonexus sp.]